MSTWGQIMNRLLACTTAAAIAAAAPAAAGESPYTGPGSNPAALNAQRSCGPQVNEADRVLVYLPPRDPRRPEIVRELQYARGAMRDGDAGLCLQHVRRAREIEGGVATGPDPASPSPYARPYAPYNRPVPYGVPAPGYYSGPYAPGYARPYGGYAPGYIPPASGGGAPW